MTYMTYRAQARGAECLNGSPQMAALDRYAATHGQFMAVKQLHRG